MIRVGEGMRDNRRGDDSCADIQHRAGPAVLEDAPAKPLDVENLVPPKASPVARATERKTWMAIRVASQSAVCTWGIPARGIGATSCLAATANRGWPAGEVRSKVATWNPSRRSWTAFFAWVSRSR